MRQPFRFAHPLFQCSSASRKFLNSTYLQQAPQAPSVSVLFSEPKIPQFNRVAVTEYARPFQCSSASRKFLNRAFLEAPVGLVVVSVLFSEPKIPQLRLQSLALEGYIAGFSALQRAENSSIRLVNDIDDVGCGFSALQRAENSSILNAATSIFNPFTFQCSSASRKFLNAVAQRDS